MLGGRPRGVPGHADLLEGVEGTHDAVRPVGRVPGLTLPAEARAVAEERLGPAGTDQVLPHPARRGVDPDAGVHPRSRFAGVDVVGERVDLTAHGDLRFRGPPRMGVTHIGQSTKPRVPLTTGQWTGMPRGRC